MAHTIKLTDDTFEALQSLCDTLGYPPELAATYAIRLVLACYREGLISDAPDAAWPPEARRESVSQDGERVIAFPGAGVRRRQWRKRGERSAGNRKE